MHEFYDHLVRDSRRTRARRCSSLLGTAAVVTARIDHFITENGKAPYPDMGEQISRLGSARASY